MKKIFLLILFTTLFFRLLLAGDNVGEPIHIAGVENPVSITISHDGLKMIIIDWPKRGLPMMKQAQRPYIESSWSSADGVGVVNKFIKPGIQVESPCFSHDGKYFYFAANFNDTNGGMDIYYCRNNNGLWGEPMNMGGPINTAENENSPSISGNNRSFFFTRYVEMKKLEDFATGELWMSEIDSLGNFWQNPQKLDRTINTGGVMNPKACDDNKTFFFSRLLNDKEKWQICWIKRLNNIHWYLPVAIDTLNSKESEICPVFCCQEGKLYYLVNNGKDEKPECSLFRFKIDPMFYPEKTIRISGKVTSRINNNPIKSTLLMTDPVMGDIKYLTHSDEKNGEWNMLLNADSEMMLHSWATGYSHNYQLFSSTTMKSNVRYDIQLFDEVGLGLNIYDSEELWPLDGTISIEEIGGVPLEIKATPVVKGKQNMILPIGTNYRISVTAKDYYPNSLDMALSGIVLFDKFVKNIELVPVKRKLTISVSDEETGNPLSATIDIVQRKRGHKFTPEAVVGKQGIYSILLREGEYFDINVRGPQGFAFQHTEFDLDTDRSLSQLDIKLKPLKRKVPIRLNNINFEINSADLLESSFEELNRVVQLVNDNPDIKLEIMAHTDDIGSDKYNNVLAEKRAQSVVEYMVLNRIKSNRLLSKGYGESMPLVPNTSEENRALNRRVEMKILDLEDNEIHEIEK